MRKFNITVNGTSYEVEVEEVGASAAPAAAPAPKAAPAAAPAPAPKAAPAPAPKAADGTKVNAPMPGTVLSVNVKEGSEVKKGDKLLVLEAMKMENEILAPCDGKVVQVAVSANSSVDTGALLIVIA